MKNRVELAFAANNAFFDGLLVSAVSAVRFVPREVGVNVSILDGGIENVNFDLLKQKIKLFHEDSEIRRLFVDERRFSDFPPWTGNYMAYARFLLPELLPDVDFVIYSDVDYLWFRDVNELWQLRDVAVPLFGTIDGNKWTLDKEESWFKKHHLPFSRDKYICSGFLMMNLRLFREERLISQLYSFLIKYSDVQFPDQAALNVVFWNRIRLLPKSWQWFTKNLPDADVGSPIALHYAGEAPWRSCRYSTPLTEQRLLWYRVLAFTLGVPLKDAFLRHYSRMMDVVSGRLIYRVYHAPVFGVLFRCWLRIRRRDAYIVSMETWARSVDLRYWWHTFKGERRVRI